MTPEAWLAEHYGIDPASGPKIEIPNCGRNTMAAWFKEWGFRTGAEIGVMQGEYSEYLCQVNPELKLYCVDPWIFYQSRYWVGPRQIAQQKVDAQARLAKYNTTIVEKWSIDAVKDFADNSLDFVYIDADHSYEHVMHDITEWSKKVRPGGVIAGHDYNHRKAPTAHAVIPAVHRYTQDNQINPWFVLGLKNKIDGMIRDSTRSWMWIKR
jgi:hypothetical protein